MYGHTPAALELLDGSIGPPGDQAVGGFALQPVDLAKTQS